MGFKVFDEDEEGVNFDKNCEKRVYSDTTSQVDQHLNSEPEEETKEEPVKQLEFHYDETLLDNHRHQIMLTTEDEEAESELERGDTESEPRDALETIKEETPEPPIPPPPPKKSAFIQSLD